MVNMTGLETNASVGAVAFSAVAFLEWYKGHCKNHILDFVNEGRIKDKYFTNANDAIAHIMKNNIDDYYVHTKIEHLKDLRIAKPLFLINGAYCLYCMCYIFYQNNFVKPQK